MSSDATQRERLRQQALVDALLSGDAASPRLQAWFGGPHAGLQRGFQAYRAHAGALAERALACAFPTIQALIGEDAFAALARDFWSSHPPQQGDLARYGEHLPAFIQSNGQLADVPYLPDVGRLEWSMAQLERAEDPAGLDEPSLSLLTQLPASGLKLELTQGTFLFSSRHAAGSVWLAHRPGVNDAHDRFAQARAALSRGDGENMLVWRQGWPVRLQLLDPHTTRWTRCLLQGASLEEALKEAGDDFVLESWLVLALQQGWLARALSIDPKGLN